MLFRHSINSPVDSEISSVDKEVVTFLRGDAVVIEPASGIVAVAVTVAVTVAVVETATAVGGDENADTDAGILAWSTGFDTTASGAVDGAVVDGEAKPVAAFDLSPWAVKDGAASGESNDFGKDFSC